MIANLCRRLRDRVARLRAGVNRWRDRVTVSPDTLVALIEDASEREREETACTQAELARTCEDMDRLRAEIEQLRLDNRALLNSLLGTAGIPPLEVPRTGAEAPALRRPSWPQIAAKREIATARKAESDRKRHDDKH